MSQAGTETSEELENAAGLRGMADRARRFAAKPNHRDEGRLKLI